MEFYHVLVQVLFLTFHNFLQSILTSSDRPTQFPINGITADIHRPIEFTGTDSRILKDASSVSPNKIIKSENPKVLFRQNSDQKITFGHTIDSSYRNIILNASERGSKDTSSVRLYSDSTSKSPDNFSKSRIKRESPINSSFSSLMSGSFSDNFPTDPENWKAGSEFWRTRNFGRKKVQGNPSPSPFDAQGNPNPSPFDAQGNPNPSPFDASPTNQRDQSVFLDGLGRINLHDIVVGVPPPCLCWNTTDYGGKNEVECKCEVWLEKESSILAPGVHRITIADPHMRTIRNNSFDPYARSLQDIVILDSLNLQEIDFAVFKGLSNLQSFSVFNAPLLDISSPLDINSEELPSLKSMRILRSGLSKVPAMRFSEDIGILNMIDLEGNRIEQLVSQNFLINVDQLILNYNRISKIEEAAFWGSKIGKLSLKGNRLLETIHPRAFAGVQSIRTIDLSETSLTFLPTEGLEDIEELWLQDVPTLKVFPSIYVFKSIVVAHLTYPYHCCAFQFPQQHNPTEHQHHLNKLKEIQKDIKCPENQSSSPSSGLTLFANHHRNMIHSSKRTKDPNHKVRHRHHHGKTESPRSTTIPNFDFEDPPQMMNLDSFGTFNDSAYHPLWGLSNNNDNFDLYSQNSYVEDHKTSHQEITAIDGNDWLPLEIHLDSHDVFKNSVHGTFHKTAADVQNSTLFAYCGKLSKNYKDVACFPAPDAFNPCEDIMGRVVLRIGVWIAVALAVVGNLAVMLVLLSSKFKMTVSKFLIVNLAVADLSMGIYLLIVASMDLHTMGAYFNYAIDWQNGFGCQLAGFLTVFSSELSIFTLTVITSERWYAITYAINLNKRLKLSVARRFMLLGWVFSITMGLLPIFGISGYSKTSICLPMDIHDIPSLVYLVVLLVSNGFAFVVISGCYVSMYCSISTHDAMATHSDLKVAKRMALLVFTDFACWAPIAFFGLTAVAGMPLINVSNSKFLLVTFYPLNSCANPYLYAIMTRQYRRDLVALCEKSAVCGRRTVGHKATYSSVNNTHQNNLHANHSCSRTHRNSTQTQITLCDFGRLTKISAHSQTPGLLISQDSITTSGSPLRTPTKYVMESQLHEQQKLSPLPEASHSSDSSVQVENIIVETCHKELPKLQHSKENVELTGKSLTESELSQQTQPFNKPKLPKLKPECLNLTAKSEVPSNNAHQKPRDDETNTFSNGDHPENKQTQGNCDLDDDIDDGSEDDTNVESLIAVEIGSPHPLKNCYTNLVVSSEQQKILDKALEKVKKQ